MTDALHSFQRAPETYVGGYGMARQSHWSARASACAEPSPDALRQAPC